jgi:primary-amine oxidase
MAVDAVSFWLKPSGFFDQNPSLDAAPAPKTGGDTCHT